jgi:hypothetical protein
MKTLQVRAGQVIGRDHIQRQTNCQDSYAVIETDEYAVGVVCDGCGEGRRSEVGAALAANFLTERMIALLRQGVTLRELSEILYAQTVEFLRGLIHLVRPSDVLCFIKDQLLFTTLGFVATDEGGLIFAAGDGLINFDEKINIRDENNRPNYIAYNLLDLPIQPRFDVFSLRAEWRRLAIASDGFEPALLPQVWGHTHPRGLQRKLNVWSDQERRFRDDATLIVVERV